MAILFALYKLAAGVYLSSPADRFRFAFGLSMAGSGWFLYTVVFGNATAAGQITAGINHLIPLSFPGFFNQSLYWLGWGYLGLLIFAAIKGHLQWKTTSRIIGEGSGKAPVEWRIFTEKHAGLLGITKKVTLKLSGTFSPATYGFIKPVILLPFSCLTGLNTNQLQAILLHELAHIRRGDYLASWMMQVAGILLYFNPFMRQLIREAKKECENACDDLVMQFEYDPFHYAQALLSVAKNGKSMEWALQAQGSQQYLLLNRISRLLGQPSNQFKFSWKALGFSCLAAGLFLATNRLTVNQPSAPPMQPMQNRVIASLAFPQKTLNQSLQDARISLRTAAAGKVEAIKNEGYAKKVKEMEMAEARERMLESQEAAETANSLTTNIPSSLILSANWADEQQSETTLKELEKAWKKFTRLLEKLQVNGDLEENEWEQVAGLIALYADIRNAIYEETERSQNLNNYASGLETDARDKVLVIVHEESTGTLVASFMDRNEINASVTEDNLPENRQQVILLRKKAPEGKKITRL